jgi:hypothetical protein
MIVQWHRAQARLRQALSLENTPEQNPEKAPAVFIELSNLIGKEKVIWAVRPNIGIIPVTRLTRDNRYGKKT